MKAAVIRAFGDPDVLKLEEIETPKPGPGEVLVKVLAAGVNRLDHYIRAGEIAPELAWPHILGGDAAGEVAALGEGVTGLAVGDRVIPAPGYPQKQEEHDIRPSANAPSFALPGLGIPGTYAQYLTAPAQYVARDETGLPAEQAATLPMVLGTSVHALKEIGGVGRGDKVLVQAGGSGSGSMQIQVARALGAEVATTVRDDAKGEFARGLGANLVINTRSEDPVARVKEWTGGRGADVVIDNLGGNVLAQSIDAAKPMGKIVAYGFAAGPEVKFDIRTLFFGHKRLLGTMANDPEDLRWGLEQVKAGKIKPALDKALPLAQAAEAHKLILAGKVTGNLVLLPWVE